MIIRPIQLLAFFFLFSTTVDAKNWKFRAREHYEFHNLSYESSNYKFDGFGNTINFWSEVPLKYSLGFSFGSILTPSKASQPKNSSFFGKSISLYSLGLEGKYFFLSEKIKGLFARGGLGLSLLDTDGNVDDSKGVNLYTGIGYEFYITKTFTIAPEIAYRFSFLEEDIEISSFVPSLGFHFYKL